jgi:hypothetical protein
MAMRNDENAVVRHQNKSGAAAASKTPATTKTRRAFGDISNRKKAASSVQLPAAGKQSLVGAKTPSLIKIASAVVKKTPFVDVKENGVVPKRRVDFLLPQKESRGVDGTTNELQSKSVQSAAQTVHVDIDADPVEDIELPAGRLWIQQQALDDADDSSVISLKGAATMKQDMDAMMKTRHELKVQWEDEEFQRLLNESDTRFDEAFSQEGESKHCALHWITDHLYCGLRCYNSRPLSRSVFNCSFVYRT